MRDSDNHAQSAPDITAAPDSFIDKWLARWPEWAVAQVFVPQAQRRTLLAWAALQQELTDAAWGGQDARPGEAKLGWWQEELLGWSRGLRRHPLGSVLQGQIDDWQILANVLPALRDSRERPADAAEAFAQVEVVARAFAGIDAALEAALARNAPCAAHGLNGALLVRHQLLHARLVASGEGAVPLQELARAGQGDAVIMWARRVPALSPAPRGGGDATAPDSAGRSAATTRADIPRFRRVTATLARQRLQQGDVARPLPAWRALWTTWQAARN